MLCQLCEENKKKCKVYSKKSLDKSFEECKKDGFEKAKIAASPLYELLCTFESRIADLEKIQGRPKLHF